MSLSNTDPTLITAIVEQVLTSLQGLQISSKLAYILCTACHSISTIDDHIASATSDTEGSDGKIVELTLPSSSNASNKSAQTSAIPAANTTAVATVIPAVAPAAAAVPVCCLE